MGCVSIECCNVLANLTTKQKREVLSIIILKKVQETLLLWLLVFLFVSGCCPSEDVRVYCQCVCPFMVNGHLFNFFLYFAFNHTLF